MVWKSGILKLCRALHLPYKVTREKGILIDMVMLAIIIVDVNCPSRCQLCTDLEERHTIIYDWIETPFQWRRALKYQMWIFQIKSLGCLCTPLVNNAHGKSDYNAKFEFCVILNSFKIIMNVLILEGGGILLSVWRALSITLTDRLRPPRGGSLSISNRPRAVE